MTESDLLHVVYEDDDLLVVDKPAGLVVHPSKQGEMSSVVGRVRLYLRHPEGRLVNRLDRETSGLVLVAKSAAVAGELGRVLAAGGFRKHYVAIVHGTFPSDARIDAPTGRDEGSPVAIKDCVRPDGAAAVTDAQLVRQFVRDEDSFSVVDVRPVTGRKHQIRIHLAHAGFPIVGDKIYGGDDSCYLRFVTGALTDDDRDRLRLEHHALHAGLLAFHWRDREWTFQAPVPARLADFAAGA